VPNIDDVLTRIDLVLHRNRRIEWLLIGLTTVLFCAGIACFVVALVTGQFAWSTPAAVTTGFLYWPLREIKNIRAKNVALAIVPVLITQLPKAKAAEELQKFLETLRGENR
jgi:hypothetical protein